MLPTLTPMATPRRLHLLVLAGTALVACGTSTAVPRATSDPAAGASAPSTPSSPSSPLGGADNPDPITMVTNPTPVIDDCNKVEIEFAPQVPSVFVLVDRSSSMFERALWNPLKDGVLAVVEQLQSDIHFGFSTYTGAAGMQCPELTTIVPIADQNLAAIKRAYDAVAKPTYKGETPTSLALQAVTKTVLQEPKNSPKYIVLVTDGEPDFCDDMLARCRRRRDASGLHARRRHVHLQCRRRRGPRSPR
jgi:hypothetical protein